MIKLSNFLQNISEEEYRKLPLPSYSSLSKLAHNNLSIFKDKDKVFKKGLSLGSVVDSLLFDEKFNIYDEYNIVDYVPDFSKENAINRLLFYMEEKNIETNDLDKLNGITKALSLWDKIKDDSKRIARLDIPEFWSGIKYIKLKKNNKPFILSEDLMIAFKMCNTLKSHKITKELFNLNNDDNIEIIHQGKIVFKTELSYEVKSMLDLIIVNHTKKIISPKDLKTGEDKSFYTNFNRFHYPMQASIYTAAIKWLIENHEELKDYKIEPFEFVYISRANPDRPYRYDMHPIYIQMGIEGWTSASGIVQKGLNELVDDYYWHIETSILDITREEYYRGGKRKIKNPLNAGRDRFVEAINDLRNYQGAPTIDTPPGFIHDTTVVRDITIPDNIFENEEEEDDDSHGEPELEGF
jgi:hypothetical protein